MDKETENQNVNQEEGLLANTPQTEEVEPKEEETTIPHKEEENTDGDIERGSMRL